MGLFDFLKRNKDDEDDFDDEFDADDDAPRTVVIDDDTELEERSADSAEIDTVSESDIEDPSPASEPDEDLASDSEEVEFDEQNMPGSGAAASGDDDDLDDDDEDDDDDDSEEGARNPMVFVFIGMIVLLIGVVGGAGYWFLGGESTEPVAQQPAEQLSGTTVKMALPPRHPQKDGGLNAIRGNGLSPPPNSEMASPGRNKSAVSDKPPAAFDRRAAALSAITGSGGGNSLNAAVSRMPSRAGQGLVIPAVTSVSYQAIPDQSKVVPLATAPDPTLLERVEGLEHPLPIIGVDGRKPWEVYARPFIRQTNNEKIAIIVKGLGHSRAASMAAIKKLPGEVSLAFSPYVRDLNDWLLRSRLAGHEVFLELPMESRDFPDEDPGPLALSTGLQVSDNLQQLSMVMSKMTGFVGLLSVMGSKFNEADGQLKPILSEIKRRGLMFVDGGGAKSRARRIAAEIALPKAYSNVYLDDPPSRYGFDQKLQRLDKLLRTKKAAIAIIHAYPSTIERILTWIRSLEDRKLTLVPVSALADKQVFE